MTAPRVIGAALSSLLVAVAMSGPARAADPLPAERIPTKTPIKHFISLMQENHSFDNYFGTYPGADGIPKGVCMPVNLNDEDARCIKPSHIGDEAVEDLSHSAQTARRQLNEGKMDGFVNAIRRSSGRVDPNVMGHYDDRDLPYYWNIADEYTLFDRFFTPSRGGSLSNHMYWVTGQSGSEKLGQEFIPPGGFDVDTIFDRLEEADVSWKFYVQNYDPTITFRSKVTGDRGSQIVWVPLLDFPRFIDNPSLFKHIVPMTDFYRDLANDNLPAVSYIVPSGSSEHPPGSLQAGETFVRTMIGALMRSPSWRSSAFMWTYDDWGGWYDHVKPPAVDAFGYGFRAPALLVSPYSKRGHIEHTTLDFTSMLKFIEENWDLQPLADRDANATSFAVALDFDQAPREAVILDRSRHVIAAAEARRAPVYIGYGLAILGFAIVLVGASRRFRRNPALAAPSDPSRAG